LTHALTNSAGRLSGAVVPRAIQDGANEVRGGTGDARGVVGGLRDVVAEALDASAEVTEGFSGVSYE
jgi:hypothetical protein